jgi:hypothetical protein
MSIQLSPQKVYDLVIIGGGPAGLALAQCVRNANLSVAIIDREKSIGGCHRVRRVNNLFTEHGPRIYSSTYTVFQQLLSDMGVSFDQLFTKYNFSIAEIGGETVFTVLSIKELSLLGFEFMKLVMNNDHGLNVILLDFLKNSNFKEDSIEMIDRICKLTDGGGADKYTLNQFLQLVNQQIFYPLYQPKFPNDKSLFVIWKNFLEKSGVDFYLNSEVTGVQTNNNVNEEIQFVYINSKDNSKRQSIYGKKFIFAIPPKNLNEIITTNNLKHNWGNLQKFANDTAYIDYISVSFHWDTHLPLPKVYGFPKSDWGVAFIVLTDYMKFDEKESKTVISTAITITDKISKNNGKTADQCNYPELINELLSQLKLAYPELPKPTSIVMSPNVYYSNTSKKWISGDTAFITTSNKGYLKFQNDSIKNMYTLGTHNGKSLYRFTSMESAVSNAVVLAKELVGDKSKIKLSRSFYVSDAVRPIIIIILLYLSIRALRL